MINTPAPAATTGWPAATPEFLLVRLASELYGLPGSAVREVLRWRAPTPVPGAPPVIPGIISQHGVVLPVLDLRLALGLPATPPDRSTRLVVAHAGEVDLALYVDAVADIVALDAEELAPPPSGRARLLGAVARHGDAPVGLIDLTAVITVVQEGA